MASLTWKSGMIISETSSDSEHCKAPAKEIPSHQQLRFSIASFLEIYDSLTLQQFWMSWDWISLPEKNTSFFTCIVICNVWTFCQNTWQLMWSFLGFRFLIPLKESWWQGRALIMESCPVALEKGHQNCQLTRSTHQEPDLERKRIQRWPDWQNTPMVTHSP